MRLQYNSASKTLINYKINNGYREIIYEWKCETEVKT